MALERVNIPTPTAPTAPADYTAILDQLEAKNQAFTGAAIPDLSAGVIRGGRVFDVGGVLYKATSDTSITGTASIYVKITPSGATAAAAYVASLTGVAWNEAFGGYYDGSGNLYIFDEARAVYDGIVGSPKTILGQTSRLELERLRITDTLVNAGTISGGTISGATLSGTTTNTGTLSGGTISGGTISGGTISGGTISGATLSGTTTNTGTLSGGAILASTALIGGASYKNGGTVFFPSIGSVGGVSIIIGENTSETSPGLVSTPLSGGGTYDVYYEAYGVDDQYFHDIPSSTNTATIRTNAIFFAICVRTA